MRHFLRSSTIYFSFSQTSRAPTGPHVVVSNLCWAGWGCDDPLFNHDPWKRPLAFCDALLQDGKRESSYFLWSLRWEYHQNVKKLAKYMQCKNWKVHEHYIDLYRSFILNHRQPNQTLCRAAETNNLSLGDRSTETHKTVVDFVHREPSTPSKAEVDVPIVDPDIQGTHSVGQAADTRYSPPQHVGLFPFTKGHVRIEALKNSNLGKQFGFGEKNTHKTWRKHGAENQNLHLSSIILYIYID